MDARSEEVKVRRPSHEVELALFTKALQSDFSNVQGNTTPEGIQLGAMAGTVDLIQRCYTGIEARGGACCA